MSDFLKNTTQKGATYMKKFIGHVCYIVLSIFLLCIAILLGNATDMPIWNSNVIFTVILLTFVISIANSFFFVLTEMPPNCSFIVKVVSVVAVVICVIVHNKLKGGVWFNGGNTTWVYVKQWAVWVAIPVYVINAVFSVDGVKGNIG